MVDPENEIVNSAPQSAVKKKKNKYKELGSLAISLSLVFIRVFIASLIVSVITGWIGIITVACISTVLFAIDKISQAIVAIVIKNMSKIMLLVVKFKMKKNE